MNLPFGQTDITSSEYRNAIDSEELVLQLTKGKVVDPEPRVDAFVRFIPDLLAWLEVHGREYPWRFTTDPWKVYVTEILLQRTHAEAVNAVFESFFSSFPTPLEVTEASDPEIFHEIETLGFGNQRTRSIKEVAELCVAHGEVPTDIDMLMDPWRVGPYSARACLMFGHNIPVPLVDANIARVMERVFGYELPAQPHKSESVYALMEAVIPQNRAIARGLNYAFIDLGSLICTPRSPMCEECPLNPCCLYALDTQTD